MINTHTHTHTQYPWAWHKPKITDHTPLPASTTSLCWFHISQPQYSFPAGMDWKRTLMCLFSWLWHHQLQQRLGERAGRNVGQGQQLVVDAWRVAKDFLSIITCILVKDFVFYSLKWWWQTQFFLLDADLEQSRCFWLGFGKESITRDPISHGSFSCTDSELSFKVKKKINTCTPWTLCSTFLSPFSDGTCQG